MNTDGHADPVRVAIPPPAAIRRQIARNRREHEVLTRLLRVSEYAAARLPEATRETAARTVTRKPA